MANWDFSVLKFGDAGGWEDIDIGGDTTNALTDTELFSLGVSTEGTEGSEVGVVAGRFGSWSSSEGVPVPDIGGGGNGERVTSDLLVIIPVGVETDVDVFALKLKI